MTPRKSGHDDYYSYHSKYPSIFPKPTPRRTPIRNTKPRRVNDRGEPVPTVSMISTTVNLNCKLNIPKIARQAFNVEYRPTGLGGGLVLRIRKPRSTARIYGSGQMVVVGTKNEQDAMIAARRVARIIQKLGYPRIRLSGYKLTNFSTAANVQHKVNLTTLNKSFCRNEYIKKRIFYDPENFPSFDYKPYQIIPAPPEKARYTEQEKLAILKSKIMVRIFSSGSVVITGAKVLSDVYSTFNEVFPLIKPHMHD